MPSFQITDKIVFQETMAFVKGRISPELKWRVVNLPSSSNVYCKHFSVMSAKQWKEARGNTFYQYPCTYMYIFGSFSFVKYK